MRDYHLPLHALGKVKTNRPRASQICIVVNKYAVAVPYSDWPRANEITPTAADWTFYDNPRASD